MFTVEYEHAVTKVVSLDEEGIHDDITLVFCEDGSVHLSQWVEELDEDQMMLISYQQLTDILRALNSAEGTFLQVSS
jgi:hypothetical protein